MYTNTCTHRHVYSRACTRAHTHHTHIHVHEHTMYTFIHIHAHVYSTHIYMCIPMHTHVHIHPIHMCTHNSYICVHTHYTHTNTQAHTLMISRAVELKGSWDYLAMLWHCQLPGFDDTLHLHTTWHLGKFQEGATDCLCYFCSFQLVYNYFKMFVLKDFNPGVSFFAWISKELGPEPEVLQAPGWNWHPDKRESKLWKERAILGLQPEPLVLSLPRGHMLWVF